MNKKIRIGGDQWLTGNWGLKPRRWGGYDVMVEVHGTYYDHMGDPYGDRIFWRKVETGELSLLNITLA